MKIFYISAFVMLSVLAACTSVDYYESPSPVTVNAQMSKEYFVMQVPLVFKGLGYTEEDINEEEGIVTVSKIVEYQGENVNLYFKAGHHKDKIKVTPYFITDDQKKYIDKDKFPDELKNDFLMDLEKFINISKNQGFPNRP